MEWGSLPTIPENEGDMPVDLVVLGTGKTILRDEKQ
jgi:hypothetical protein